MAIDFAAGCMGGCAGLMVGYPLDTIKVHIQTQDHRNPKYKGTWHCFRSILARESVSGLYRGMTSPMAGVAVVNAIVFGVYGQTQRNLSEPDHLLTHFLAGASAGLAQSPVCSPLELAKTRLQLQGSEGSRFTGPIQCLRQVYRLEGHRGVFNGLGITAVREAPSYGVYFLTYEALTRSSPAAEISTFHMLMAGGLAGTASWIGTYPVDVIKSRLQADGTGRYTGAIDCLRQSMQNEGYKWLFRGLNSTILRAFPTNAATFTVVTWTFRIFGEDNEDLRTKKTKVIEEPRKELAQGRVHQTMEPREETSLIEKCNSLVARAVTEYTYESRSYHSVGFSPIGNDDDDAARRIEKSDNHLEQRKVNGDDDDDVETACKKTEGSSFPTGDITRKTRDADEDPNDGNSSSAKNGNNVLLLDGSSTNAQRLIAGNGGRCMSTQAMQSLYDLRQNNVLCDAVLRLEDGGVFPIHRAILSACSNYFRTLFTTTLHSRERTDILLPGVNSPMMNHLLEYAYLRSLDVNPENVCQLLVTADYLSVIGVLDLCREYLKKNLSPEICMRVLRFAREHFCRGLEQDAYQYVMRHFVLVAQRSEDLLHLPIEELRSLVGADELNVKSEEVVWELVLKWINHDPEARKGHIVDLLKNIRLGLLDTQFFLEKVKDHPYVTGNEACRPIIIETLKFLYDLEMITQKHGEVPTPEIARPRVPHEILFAIAGWIGNSSTSYMETYDTRADRWIQVREEDPSGPRSYHGTAAVGFSIYVIGGFNGRDYFSSCRCFNAVTKEWREVAPMNARRCYVSVAVVNDVVYAIGGYDGHYRQKTAERYNYRTNQWSLIAPMAVQRSDASATTLNDKIYITGGFNGQECLNSAEVYDPEVNQWTRIAPMRTRRSGLSCIAYHGCVYVIGGYNGIARMYSGEKYNPATNTWSLIPDMYNPRSNFAIEVIDDMIFAIGGFNGVTTIFHVECYDEKTNEWYEATDIGMHRSGLSACVIVGLPNVQDYIHKHRERLMEEKRQKLLALEFQHNQHQQQQQEQQLVQDENDIMS